MLSHDALLAPGPIIDISVFHGMSAFMAGPSCRGWQSSDSLQAGASLFRNTLCPFKVLFLKHPHTLPHAVTLGCRAVDVCAREVYAVVGLPRTSVYGACTCGSPAGVLLSTSRMKVV
jgi:hypothetical protein